LLRQLGFAAQAFSSAEAHRGQVMRKMKADSLPDLVTMAARLGVRSARTHS
jgi:FixJ family two-component response regulator